MIIIIIICLYFVYFFYDIVLNTFLNKFIDNSFVSADHSSLQSVGQAMRYALSDFL